MIITLRRGRTRRNNNNNNDNNNNNNTNLTIKELNCRIQSFHVEMHPAGHFPIVYGTEHEKVSLGVL